ncbi:MAG: transporter, partial [bacterium]
TFGRLHPAFPQGEGAAHRFGGTLLNPILDADTVYSGSATGFGDIALRVKYSFLRGSNVDLAALLDVRLPTGEEENFLGAGETNTRIAGIASKKFGNFTPHLNLGYERRPADFDSDQFEIIAGFDQKIASGVTFAAEFFGAFALDNGETLHFFPEGSVTISDSFTNSNNEPGALVRHINFTNIPDRKNDQTLDASLGFRAAFSEQFLILGNVIVPLNDGDLRSSVAPTIGATINF